MTIKSMHKEYIFTFIYYPLVYATLVALLWKEQGAFKGLILGLIIGLLTSPIYGPFLIGKWQNYFAHLIRNIKLERRLVNIFNKYMIKSKNAKGVLLFIAGWLIYLCFLLFPVFMGILLLDKEKAPFLLYLVTLVFCWIMIDAIMGYVNTH